MIRNLYIPAFLIFILFEGCKHDTFESVTSYPDNISKIFTTKCATPGCHNTKSKDGASGLDLSDWDKLFQGNSSGAVVIPYARDLSPMMYFANPYNDLGTVHIVPAMPYNMPSLSHDEVKSLYDWISAGAPDKNGVVKFADNPDRMKYYVANQACDEVAVFDAETKVIMRYVPVGEDPSIIENPHQIRISPDGKYWYVLFRAGQLIQKFRTADDQLVGSINFDNTLPPGFWNTMCITSDGKNCFVVSLEPNGKIAYLDLDNMQFLFYIGGSASELSNPHGSYLSKDDKTLYVTAQVGNFIYKIDVTTPALYDITKVVLQTGQLPSTSSSLDPHEIRFSPDESKYFVTCQTSNEVRIFQASNDSLLATIPVGTFPQEAIVCPSRHLLFVTCQEGPAANGWKGAVAVIDYQSNTLVKTLYDQLYQPHGIAVDEDRQRVYVVSLNYSDTGPAPHHVGSCGGRNGFVSIIDLNTLVVLPDYRNEVLPFPYWVEYRP